jgi:hypothetical protein
VVGSSKRKEEWGDLRVEPRTRYSQNPIDLVELAFTPVAAVVILYLLVVNWSDLRDEDLPMLVVGVALWIIALSTGAYLLHKFGTYRPFRVHSRGFTSPEVPFPCGLTGRDVFVPFDAVERVERHHLATSGPRGPMMVVTYMDGSEARRVEILFMDVQGSTGKVIDVFEEHVPDRVEMGPLLGPD